MPMPGPTWAPSGGGRGDGRSSQRSSSLLPVNTAQLRSQLYRGLCSGGSCQKHITRRSFCRAGAAASQNRVPRAHSHSSRPGGRGRGGGRGTSRRESSQPSLGPVLWPHLEKPRESLSAPRPAPGSRVDPGLGCVEAPGDHRPGLGSAAPAGRLAPGPSTQPAERRGWRPPTSKTHSRGRGKLLSVSNQSRCRQRAGLLVPRGSVYRSVSREDTPDRRRSQETLRDGSLGRKCRGKVLLPHDRSHKG